MKSKVLITGGSGLFALNFAIAKRNSHDITLGTHIREPVLANTTTQYLNLDSVEHLVRDIKLNKPSLLIHAAGLTNVEACEANPEQAWHVNVTLAANVARACKELDLPLAHISTDHLFSDKSALANEQDQVAPINIYGLTKAEAEAQVQKVCEKALIIRTNFYGWGTRYRCSFSDVIINALRDGRQITLFQDVYYTPILIEFAAEAILDLVDRMEFGVFNVVGDESISKYDFGMKLAEKFNLDKRLIKAGILEEKKDLTPRPHNMSLSNAKVSRVIGRRLGSVADQLKKLHAQEQEGLAKEMQSL
jgi:dTDP-4-dehydrorhamnose reductase